MSNTSRELRQKEDYLSLKSTTALKGILAIFIILHHLNLVSGAFKNLKILDKIFSNLGFLCVGAFFLISGYGLISSYKRKGEKYLNDIIPKKVLPLYILCIILAAGYYLLTKEFNLVQFVKILYKFGDYGYLWYFTCILIFYLLFFIIHKLKIGDKLKFILTCAGVLLYCAIDASLFPYATWKYCSCFAFLLGYAWFYAKEDIDEFLKKNVNYWITLIFAVVLFAGLFVFEYFLDGTVFLKQFLACLFPVILLLLSQKIPLNNPITRFLGKISLELYSFQYFCIYFYREIAVIGNKWLYCLAVLASVIAVSIVLHPLIKIYLKYSGKFFCLLRDKIISLIKRKRPEEQP